MPIENADDEAGIRARLDQWATGLRAKDIDAIMAAHAPDLLSFDCHSQLRLKGAQAYRTHLEACLPCMQGPMMFEMHDLEITAQGDLASALSSPAAAPRERMATSMSAGCAPPFACATRMANGWSCTDTSPRRSTPRAAEDCSTSSRSTRSGRAPRTLRLG